MNSISLTPNETIDSLMQSALKKVSYSVSQRMLLGIMAGMYIALGSQGFIVMYGNPLLRAAVFPVGLMLIVLLGGELFTGNCLMTFALIHKKIDAKSYTFSLLQVLAANLIGSLAAVLILYFGGVYNNPEFAESAAKVANAKVNLTFVEVLLRGIFCNILVTAGVWISTMSKNVTGKILGCWFTVMLFVLSGYEHSVANMFFLPLGAMIDPSITIAKILHNLIPAIIGNYIGGGIIVPFVYNKAYKSKTKDIKDIKDINDNKVQSEVN